MNDQYLSYNLEDLLTDDTFVDWVLKGDKGDQWNAWLAKNPDMSDALKEAGEIVKKIKFNNPPIESKIKHGLWARIENTTQAKEIPIGSTRNRWLYGLAAAASIALLAIIVLQDQAIVYTTDVAMSESVMLPSQSEVVLSPVSSISYKEKNWVDRRDVELKGKGHFKVSKGVPFTVKTDNGSVQVLGTEFDVVSLDDAFQVLVTEGKVKVASGNHSRILTAGMGFYKNPKWDGIYELNNDWKADQMFFVYRDEPIGEVLKAITFNYNLIIDNSSIDNSIQYTGSFDSTDSIEAALESVLWPLNISYELIDNKIVLSPG